MTARLRGAIAPAAALCLMAALAGCRSGTARATPEARPRIVSLHDVTTEILVELGAGDRLVGVQEAVQLQPATKAAIVGVPRVDGLESILGVRPTQVLGLGVTAARSPDLVAFLRARHIDVWLADPKALDDVLGLVTEIGARLGEVPRAAALAARLRARMAAGSPALSDPVPVFVYDCCDPPFTAGGAAVLTDVIRRAGGRNVFDDLTASWSKVSWEAVIARRPRLIVIHDYAYDGQGDVASKRQRLGQIRALAEIPTTVLALGESLGGLPSFEGLDHLRRAIQGQGGPR